MTTADAFLDGPIARPARGEDGERTETRPRFAARILPHGRRPRRFSDAWPLRRALVILMALVGASVMLYPAAAAWFSDRVHAGQVVGYTETVRGMTTAEQAAALDAAHAYNDTLPDGPLRDPYTLTAAGEATEVGEGVAAYRDALAVGGGGMLGVLDIPAIGVDLPIYHGTSDATLAKGIGHLYGSSLPVGGPGTHAVLTGHSGWVDATLLNELTRMRLGDTFTVNVLGEVLTYRVDQILTVLPSETEALRREAGKDYLTLITCTPTGINSHRLLVRGERVPTAESGAETVRSTAVDPGFPWWAAILAGVLVIAVLATRPLRRRGVRMPRHASEESR